MQLVDVARRRSETHANVTVTWGARFAKTGARLIEFDITYLLEDLGEGRKILAYVIPTDRRRK